MHAFEFLLMGLGLSMDAFAAAVGKGLSVRRYALSQSVWCGLWFGGFQMLMPLLGYRWGCGLRMQCTQPRRGLHLFCLRLLAEI